jgi:hypothetical protein
METNLQVERRKKRKVECARQYQKRCDEKLTMNTNSN